MAAELNEETGFKVSIKTLIGIAFAIATIVGMWFALFDMKDQIVRQTIMTTQEDVKELKSDMDRIEEKIDNLR